MFNLEPVTSLIKLSLLNYKQEGTKLSLSDSGIFLQEPTIYQGIVRYLYSDSRADLEVLHNLLKTAILWISVNMVQHKETMGFLLKKCISGLLKLSRSYQKDNDTYTLILTLSQLIQNYVYDDILPTQDIPLDNNIDKAWKDKSELEMIKKTYQEIDTYLENKRITDIEEIYCKINQDLQPIEVILQRKDVLYISKIDNSYLIK